MEFWASRWTIRWVLPAKAASKCSLSGPEAALKKQFAGGRRFVRVGGKPLLFPSSLELYRAALFPAGARVELAVERAGKQLALTVVPDRAAEQVRNVETFVAQLERCGGDVACATGCADKAEQKSISRIESEFVKTLDSQPGSPVRLTLRAGRLGNEAELEMGSTRLDYRNGFFLEDLMAELGPLLATAERVDFELRRSPAGIGMTILYPDPGQLLGGPRP